MTMALMTEEWVSLWYQCLSQNIDYSIYCDARDAGDLVRCRQYEAKFDKIGDIYADFGTLDGWPEDGMASQLWVEWFEPRKHLFIDVARLVTDARQYVAHPGFALLEVPLQPDADATAAIVSEFLARQYASGKVVPAPRPKYALNAKGSRPANGIEQVRKACRSVTRSYRYDPITFEERRYRVAVTEFVRNEVDYMGWAIDPKAREQLAKEGTLSEERFEPHRVSRRPVSLSQTVVV
jgi:hypothetical protein